MWIELLCIVIIVISIVIILEKCTETEATRDFFSLFHPHHKCDILSISPETTTGPRLPPKSKYIVFQIDCGGLNNIRMQYEILSILSNLSDRSLVLHPPVNWYLLGNEKLSPEDIFDFDCWASHVSILRPKEWFEILGVKGRTEYKSFFSDLESGVYGKVYDPEWSPGKQKFDKKFLLQNDDPIWYFYCRKVSESRNTKRKRKGKEHFENLEHRMFGNPECYFSKLSNDERRKLRKLIWKAFKFRQDYYEKTSELMHKLNLKSGEYNAIHLRNWEGKQPQFRLRSQEEVINNLSTVENTKPILFLSQDVVKNLPQRIREKVEHFLRTYTIIRPSDIGDEYTQLTRTQQSIIEMLLCVPAHKFFGSPSSTYSTGIMQFRGNYARYCNKIDDNPYFLDKKKYNKCGDSWSFGIVVEDTWRDRSD